MIKDSYQNYDEVREDRAKDPIPELLEFLFALRIVIVHLRENIFCHMKTGVKESYYL